MKALLARLGAMFQPPTHCAICCDAWTYQTGDGYFYCSTRCEDTHYEAMIRQA